MKYVIEIVRTAFEMLLFRTLGSYVSVRRYIPEKILQQYCDIFLVFRELFKTSDDFSISAL